MLSIPGTGTVFTATKRQRLVMLSINDIVYIAIIFFLSEIGSCYIADDGFKLMVIWLPPPKCRDYSYEPSHLAY